MATTTPWLQKDTLHCVIRARGRASEAAPLATELLQIMNGWKITEPQVLAPLHQTIGESELDLGELDAAATELGTAWRTAEEGGACTADPCHPRRVALMKALARVDDARPQGETPRRGVRSSPIRRKRDNERQAQTRRRGRGMGPGLQT
mgnify:CR=1 FL=1